MRWRQPGHRTHSRRGVVKELVRRVATAAAPDGDDAIESAELDVGIGHEQGGESVLLRVGEEFGAEVCRVPRAA